MPPHACANSAKSMGWSSHAVFGIAEKDHLLPLDLAEGVVLDDDDLDRQLVLHGGREFRHQHRETAVANEGDALPVGIGDLGGDGVRQTAAPWWRDFRRASATGPLRAGICRANQVVMVPLSQETIASSRRRLPNSCATTCGFIGLSVRRGLRSASASANPSCLLLRLLQESAVGLAASSGRSACRRSGGCRQPVRPRPDSAAQCVWDRDRSAPRAPGPASGMNSMYGNVLPTISSVSQSSIASCEGLVPSSPMPPVVYGLSSGTQALPSSALMIGAPSVSANASSSSPASSAPRPARMATFFPRSECRRLAADRSAAGRRALRAYVMRSVVRHIALRRARSS